MVRDAYRIDKELPDFFWTGRLCTSRIRKIILFLFRKKLTPSPTQRQTTSRPRWDRRWHHRGMTGNWLTGKRDVSTNRSLAIVQLVNWMRLAERKFLELSRTWFSTETSNIQNNSCKREIYLNDDDGNHHGRAALCTRKEYENAGEREYHKQYTLERKHTKIYHF